MKILYFVILVSILVIACNDNTRETNRGSDRYRKNMKLSYGHPITFLSSPSIAIPIIIESRYINTGINKEGYDNIVVIKNDSVQKALFTEPVFIQNIKTFSPPSIITSKSPYYTPIEKYSKELFNNLFFFEKQVLKQKQRKNKELYLYDMKIDSLIKLSHDSTELIQWDVIKSPPSILMTLQSTREDNIQKRFHAHQYTPKLNDHYLLKYYLDSLHDISLLYQPIQEELKNIIVDDRYPLKKSNDAK